MKENAKTKASSPRHRDCNTSTPWKALAPPDATDEVTVHYRGTLLDGTEFDSSLKRGEPISFPLNGVIRGWTEGLQLMKEGGKTTFYIPQELAYGARPAPGGAIPPTPR